MSAPSGDAHVVEADVGGPGAFLAHLGVLGADLDARGVGGHQEHRDARRRRRRRAGSRANTMNRSAVGALVMNRFWPVMIQPLLDPSRTAFVRNPDGFDPAPGSVSANDATTSPEAIGSSQRDLLLVGAEPDEDLAGDAVVGAEHRPQRQRV